MPELPDIVVYLEALEPRIVGQPIEGIRIKSPFLVRTWDPPIEAAVGKTVRGLERRGKRIVWHLDDDLFLILHLMIAGRLRLRDKGAGLPGKMGLAAFDFPGETLVLTEASPKKRASLHLVQGQKALEEHDPGGVEVLECDLSHFQERLQKNNHTLKRALTDPRLFSGIGNAYSDEILHRARLSPLKWTNRLEGDEIERLFEATRRTLEEWTVRLREEVGDGFPEKVTAFRKGMAVHGRFREPCPDCGEPVQRIRYAQNETNYCARCQTDGKVLADRALSRLLKKDWPRTLEELEEHRSSLRGGPE